MDDLLLPVIQKMGKRGQAAAMNKQGNLNDFFDVTSGNGTYAPRKRQAYASKRLQQVVSDWRREQQKPTGESEEGPAKKKVKTKSPAGASRKKGGRARGGSTRKEKHASSSDYASDSSGISPKERTIQLRPRPKPAQGQ